MRVIIAIMILFISTSVISAQGTGDNPPFTQELSALGIIVYYPDTMSALAGGELVLYFDNGYGDTNTISISTPQSLSDFWNISEDSTDDTIMALSEKLIDQRPSMIFLTEVYRTIIGGYEGEYAELGEENNAFRLFLYAFMIDDEIYSVRLATYTPDPTNELRLMSHIVKAMVITPDQTGSIPTRTAPIPDVRLSERMTSLGGTITFALPFGWVSDDSEENSSAFADSQATLDRLNDDFKIPPDGIGLGIIEPSMIGDMGITEGTAYETLYELQTLISSTAEIYRYDNLPYEAYYHAISNDILPDTHLITMQVGDDMGSVAILFIFTTDFDRDEALVIAVMNSIALAE
jgi:hypothetical protein